MVLRNKRLQKKGPAVSGLVLALGLASATGDLHAQTSCTGCNEHPIAVTPLGYQVNRFIAVQTANAAPAQFVFFPNEWYMGGCELGPMGCRHIHAVARAAPCAPCPIMVETSGDPFIDETRRAYLVKSLEGLGLADADKRVIINFPATQPMRGEHAEIIYLGWLNSVRVGWNRGLYPGVGTQGFFGAYGPGSWGQGFWGLGAGGGGYGLGGYFGIPYRN